MSEWIPLRWPADWKDPELLDLVKATPVNCLTGNAPPPFPLSDVPFFPLDSKQLAADVTVIDGVWPTVQAASGSSFDAESGPTGGPWVDSNGWIAQLARAEHPGKQVWINYDASGEQNVVRPRDYILPVAEAEAYSAHWIISLDQNFRDTLAAKQEDAVGAWKKIADTLRLFQQNRRWRNWKPVAALAVISDFTGDNEFLSHEFLNLASRRPLAFQIIRKKDASDADLATVKAAIYIDSAPLTGQIRDILLAYARQGGMLFLPEFNGSSPPSETRLGHHVFPAGKGSIVAPEEEWYDPYILAERVHQFISRREDVVRIWNAGSINSHYVEDPTRKTAVVHLVNYSRGGSLNAVTIGLREPCRSARFLTPEKSAVIEPQLVRQGIELPLPSFSDYAAIEVDR